MPSKNSCVNSILEKPLYITKLSASVVHLRKTRVCAHEAPDPVPVQTPAVNARGRDALGSVLPNGAGAARRLDSARSARPPRT